jgi:hypothetical protein
MYFNQPIFNLPNSLTHLTLGFLFNQEINNLPNSLTHLKLGNCFNQEIYNLPLRLKTINISKCKFKKSIKENLLDIIPIGCEIIIKNKFDF